MASRQDRRPFQRFGALSAELSPAERAQREAAVRTAAIAAARGRPLPPAVLDFIVASSDWRQDQQTLEARAAGIADHVVHDVRAPNSSGAHPQEVAAYLAALGRQFGDYRRGLAGAMAEDSGDRDGPSSSARLDRISASDAALLSEMRHHAIRCGVHWAADRPEVLRLGREAIELFARTGFTRQSFDRLRQVGFEARDAVTIARFAEEMKKKGHTIDVNALASATAESVTAFGGDTPEGRQRWLRLFREYYDNPDSTEARTALDRALTEVETHGTPEQRDKVEELRPLLRLERQATAQVVAAVAAESTVMTTVATTASAVDKAAAQDDAGIDALNAPAPTPPQASPTPQPAPQPTRHVAGPR